MPHARFPRIIGFEVPPLKAAVDTVRDAPIVALLDVAPPPEWVAAFDQEVAALQTRWGLAAVSVEGERLFFFASESDGRRLAGAIRGLVERVSRLTLDARFAAALGQGPVPNAQPTLPAPVKLLGRVLLVEDDATLCGVASDMLTTAGWSVVTAGHAEDAMAFLNRGEPVAAVFTDVDMPGAMDGLALAARVRHQWPTVGLVVTSGRYSVDAGGIPEGAVFLTKPYQRRQLLALLALVTGTVA